MKQNISRVSGMHENSRISKVLEKCFFKCKQRQFCSIFYGRKYWQAMNLGCLKKQMWNIEHVTVAALLNVNKEKRKKEIISIN